jgi:hypothetical protein
MDLLVLFFCGICVASGGTEEGKNECSKFCLGHSPRLREQCGALKRLLSQVDSVKISALLLLDRTVNPTGQGNGTTQLTEFLRETQKAVQDVWTGLAPGRCSAITISIPQWRQKAIRTMNF